MIETSNYINDDERQAWLTSARAYGAVFPEFADLVALIEARLEATGPEIMEAETAAALERLEALRRELAESE